MSSEHGATYGIVMLAITKIEQCVGRAAEYYGTNASKVTG